jgi:phospholipid/cholesterol/gamma-HCH transport system substrate-binding protein
MRENKPEIGEAFDGLRKTLKGTGSSSTRTATASISIADNVETRASTARRRC